MSAPVESIVQVTISVEDQAVQQQSFSVPAIFGPSGRFTPVTTNITTTDGSKTATVVSATGITKGMGVSGTGIPANTTVATIVGTTVTLSKAATATGTVSGSFVDLIRAYTTLAGMAADGFLSSDAEYVRAAELLQQALQPEIFYVGSYDDSVAQVDTLAVNSLDTSHLYSFSLNGSTISYQASGGSTQQSILDGLNTAIGVAFPSDPPVAGVRTSTGVSALLTLTSSTKGVAVTYASIDTKLTHANTVENHTITDDIADAQAAPSGDLWYGLLICSQNAWDIEQVASYIETQLKIFGADTNDANVLTSATTDVASSLKGDAYDRTWLLYSGTAADGAAAAWMGGQLPQVPGASTWKFKTLVGITPDDLTAAQRLQCIGIPGTPGKNCNIYETVGGVGITEEGFMASGRFIDITVGIDWLTSEIQTNVFTALVNSPKIPYTAAGIAVIENAIRAAIQTGVNNGLIDGASDITITAPDIADISTADKANRLLPDVRFSCRLAGALHFVEIQGLVTV